MDELLATNNLVTISYAEALLGDAGIEFLVVDQNMSILEGSIGVIPRRILVAHDQIVQARRLISDAGLEKELTTREKHL